MSVPFTLKPGLFFDTRSILISVTALSFGPVPALFTAIVAILYRVSIGGTGYLPGIAVISSSLLIRLTWRRWLLPKSHQWRWLSIYAMGIVTHLVMLACMLLIPDPDNWMVVRSIALPVMLIYPITSIVLSLLLVRQKDRFHAQDKLRASEEQYRLLYETINQGIVYQAADGSILSANPAAEKILGLTLDQMQGRTSMDPGWKSIREDGSVLPGTEHPAMIALQTGQPFGPFIMGIFQPRISEHVWISVFATPLFQPDESKPHQVYATFQDISGEYKANQNYQLLFNKMVDAFSLHRMIYDKLGNPIDYEFLAVNPAFENMTGFKAQNIIGQTVLKIIPETESYWIELYSQVALTGEPASFSNYSAALDKYFEVSAYQPAPNQFACTFIDITDRVQAEIDLKASEAKFRSYVENAPDGIFVADESGRYVEVNQAATRITGYSQERLLELSIRDLTVEDALDEALSQFRSLQDTGSMRSVLPFIHEDGSKRWWKVDAVKLSDNRFLGFSNDITDRKNAEDQLIHTSYHDFLTGLHNRRFFETEMARLDCAEELPLSIIIGDINGLKLINDAISRAEGDKIIIVTAGLLRDCCQRSYVLARTSGDEFSILLPRTDRIQALKVLEKIKTACQTYNSRISSDMFQINLSLGFETKESIQTEFSQVMKSAEDFMYKRKLLESRSSHSAIVASIKATLLEKSHETKEHADRLVELSRKIGIELDLSQKEMDNLELLSVLHDIGKVGIPDHILNKPGKLTDDEWLEMKKHPEVGYRIASSSPELLPIADYILCHHERWDGHGYPQKLAGKAIPLLSRILAVVDSYDAMTENRPYRKAMSHEESMAEIIRCSGKQFDPLITRIFVNSYSSTISSNI